MNDTIAAKGTVIRGCNGQAELVEVVELLDRSFDNTPREYFERHVLHDPTLRLQDTRILIRNDKIVSTVQIFPRVMQVAGMELAFGGIGNVATDPSERRAGYASVMMNDAIDEMRAEGFPLSMLTTTINAYYERFGYRTIVRCVAIIAPLQGTMHPAVRRFRRETDYACVKELYRKYNAHSVGPLVRDELYWEAHFTFCGEDPGMFLVLEEGGMVVAYARARVNNGHLEIMEFASEHGFAQNFDVLLRSLCSLAPGVPIRLYYAEREQERLHVQYPLTVQEDTDLMILVLDNRITPTVERHLMKRNTVTFWMTDCF
jgi:predicted acetyltransferase